MAILTSQQRKVLGDACTTGRRASEEAVRAALTSLAVTAERPPAHLTENDRQLRRGLRAKARQLGDQGEKLDPLVAECAYEQWHRLLFARFLAENNLLIHPEYRAPVTLDDCEELAESLNEPDGWCVAARFAAEILPGIFRLDDPCVRLRLAPEGRLSLESIIAGLPEEVFACDDALGWVYQFWQKDKKDEVNVSERKIGGADLAPVTQLFTENYMVRFLLENSLGAWWAVRHPESPLVKDFEYLRVKDDGTPAAGTFDAWPNRISEVTVMDPCCGSGHFLVEAFAMLWQMRAEEAGLSAIEAQDAVLRDNLFGLELDPRCVQIAIFAVALAAWKQGGGWRQLPTPHIACSGIPAKAPLGEWTALAGGDSRHEAALERLHNLFQEADTLGSLIDPRRAAAVVDATGLQRSMWDIDFDDVIPLLEKAAARETDDPATAVLGADAAGIARAAVLLDLRVCLVATNVPYLSAGRQSPTLRQYLELAMPEGSPDIATAFIQRFIGQAHSLAVVSPQSWQQQQQFEAFRRLILGRCSYRLFARLGNDVWQRPGAGNPFKLHTVLSVFGSPVPATDNHSLAAIDVGREPIEHRPSSLGSEEIVWLSPRQQWFNPEARIVIGEASELPLLEAFADSYQGLATADFARFGRRFWEQPRDDSIWSRLQSTVVSVRHYGGREGVVRWEQGRGPLAQSAAARVQGMGAWGHRGVAISQMGDLKPTLYTGEIFDNNVAAMIPREPCVLPALWAFCSSPEYGRLVRQVNSRPGVTNRDLLKVPFDLDRWQAAAKEEYPKGLPEPWSDDPKQWLFEGQPALSTAPLQVATARLVGYRWPEQPVSDKLDDFADADGIVCLPSVTGEPPAANRLQQVLAAAFGEAWSAVKQKVLLEDTGSKKNNLGDWLRDDFFRQHCALFENRPFIWHIWDGQRDGFAALVNYHRLDHKTLVKLTYTYLGDWIERQRAQVREEVAGAEDRLAAATKLRKALELILEGEPPYDIYVRWKSLAEQPMGWNPDVNDGVRLNVRPFVEAGILRSPFNIHWRKDRGRNPDGSERLNDRHFTVAEKHAARDDMA
jgi:hypothetical protein